MDLAMLLKDARILAGRHKVCCNQRVYGGSRLLEVCGLPAHGMCSPMHR